MIPSLAPSFGYVRTARFTVITHDPSCPPLPTTSTYTTTTCVRSPLKSSTKPVKYSHVHIAVVDEYIRDMVYSILHGDFRYTITNQDDEEGSSRNSDDDAAPPPPPTQFTFGDYENVHWDSVHSGALKTSNFFTRKGISRKAQLSLYTSRFISKNPLSPLKKAMPATYICETWAAFDEECTKMTMPNGQSIEIDSKGMGKGERVELCLGGLREIFEEVSEVK